MLRFPARPPQRAIFAAAGLPVPACRVIMAFRNEPSAPATRRARNC